jgi:predicted CXXCH cytochrome family protein
VERIEKPPYDYGYVLKIDILTPPDSDGTYQPGTAVTFRLNQLDDSGTLLHPLDTLPSYNEFLAGKNQTGLQYYRSFFDPSATYYRRKHRERMLMAQIIGPVHKLAPIRRVLELEDFLGDNVTKVLARPEHEGLYSEYQLFPPAPDLFGGAFDPDHVSWDKPVNTRFTFHIPENADPGTYYVTAKGRRAYLGQDIAGSETIEIQVSTTERGQPSLTTGGCSECHYDGGAQDNLLHRNPNMAACNGCHTPMTFELDNIVLVRSHFIHSRSDRYDAPLSHCSSCHPEEESTRRTSKAACLSCHRSYPDSHIQRYGPIHSIYVGGKDESFDRCAEACHTSHPESGY